MNTPSPPAVVVATEDQLRSAFRAETLHLLREEIPEIIRRASRKPWLTRDEVLELTGWSARTLAYLKHGRRIAFAQHGRKILFETASLEALLASGYVPRHTRSPRRTS